MQSNQQFIGAGARELRAFLSGQDPVAIARGLIGMELTTRTDGGLTSGFITETEAYWAPQDRASHAFGGRRTARTEPFFAGAGTSYVYLCYGIHELFNVITGPAEVPHAVLIRAVEPNLGLEEMLRRRHMENLKPQLSRGPGVVSKALGITRIHNALDLLDPASPVQLSFGRAPVMAEDIVATPRIGIDGAGAEWASRPWRFYHRGNRFVSKLNAFR
ncbi:DNA-3-methyladenine glycosylase [Neolewinella xylanilytica]|uniref:Putative 3-methyladenine DNA glycosylase n=1 Tax=Neolewinella xylanilytica TaxID=1514080 RepID=A0A2S6I3H9_9BACT|nr:DNA-3-methyladenine glycosylase [Neolewinella xylanilytica]PPK85736.1 DNA-3-methyladenine glycosylase [Neolewinella xylanilytica]